MPSCDELFIRETIFSIMRTMEISEGGVYYFSSDLLPIMILCKQKKIKFDADFILKTIEEFVGKGSTIIIPTYNFDFCNKGYYDYCKSPSQVGYLGNVALRRDGYKRTWSPVHSFAVWGKYKDDLCEIKNKNSFGKDSPFAFMFRHKAIEVGLGLDGYEKGCTFLHQIEVDASVPWRFLKQFKGTYVDADGSAQKVEIDYPARYLSVQYNKIKNGRKYVLEKCGAAKCYIVNTIPIYRIDMMMAYDSYYEELTKNKSEHIFDFSINREKIYNMDFDTCQRGDRDA